MNHCLEVTSLAPPEPVDPLRVLIAQVPCTACGNEVGANALVVLTQSDETGGQKGLAFACEICSELLDDPIALGARIERAHLLRAVSPSRVPS